MRVPWPALLLLAPLAGGAWILAAPAIGLAAAAWGLASRAAAAGGKAVAAAATRGRAPGEAHLTGRPGGEGGAPGAGMDELEREVGRRRAAPRSPRDRI